MIIPMSRGPHSPARAGLCGPREGKGERSRSCGGAKAPPFRSTELKTVDRGEKSRLSPYCFPAFAQNERYEA
jgi:hypothetical protein